MFTQEFMCQLAKEMAPLVAALITADAVAPKKRLLEVSEAAEYIGRAENALRILERRGLIPAVRKDGRVFFDLQDLDRWIESGK